MEPITGFLIFLNIAVHVLNHGYYHYEVEPKVEVKVEQKK